MPQLWIRPNVFELVAKIKSIANSMFMKSGLPNLASKLCSNVVRKAAFDALCASFNRLICCRSQQNMEMFRHDSEAVQ